MRNPCYSDNEHSQSDEFPVELPSIDKIEADIDKVISWHKEFKIRVTTA
ncbi:MAG: hypothetical protein OXB84_02940 [Halobacteriovoraceae bacterium]|nr:hypothetical protein [Halobacteriovoraceae bacterium]